MPIINLQVSSTQLVNLASLINCEKCGDVFNTQNELHLHEKAEHGRDKTTQSQIMENPVEE
jgi:hypothetical protein